MRQSILIFTDSLGLPRNNPEPLILSETYVSMLRENFKNISFIHVGLGGATIDKLYQQSQYYSKTSKPLLTFVQCGIVDCFPRPFSKVELYMIKSLFGEKLIESKLFKSIIKFLRRRRGHKYTSIKKFEIYVNKFAKDYENIFFIPIVADLDGYKIEGIELKKVLKSYNEAFPLEKRIEIRELKSEYLSSDNHHLTKEGNKFFFGLLKKLVAESQINNEFRTQK